MSFNRLFLVILLIVGPFQGIMEAMMSEDVASTITIKNNTSNKLQVVYQLNNSIFKPTLTIDQEVVVPDFPSIKALYIEPYGDIKGKISLSAITSGLLKDDLLKRRELKLYPAQLNNKTARLTVNPGGAQLSYLLGTWIAEKIAPYTLDVKIIPTEETKSDAVLATKTIVDFFPQVKNALVEGKKVETRYFLNIGQYADHEELDNAHADLIALWAKRRDKNNSEEVTLAKDVLNLIEEAYKKELYDKKFITEPLDNFDELVKGLSKPREYIVTIEYTPDDIKTELTTVKPASEETQEALKAVEDAFNSNLDDSL